MTPKSIISLLLTSVLVGCGGGAGVDTLEVVDVWARPTPTGSTVAAVYMRIGSPTDDELVEVSTPRAASAHVHVAEGLGESDGGGHSSHGGSGSEITMSESILTFEAGEWVELAPGGIHVMLEGLDAPLVEGNSFELTLTFREAGTRTVIVDVSSNAPSDG